MAEKYALLFHIYRTPLSRTVRVMVLFFILFLIYANLEAGLFPKFSLFFLIWFCIIEIFFHFKIARVRPNSDVSKTENPVNAFTFPLLELFVSTHDTKSFLQQLGKQSPVKLLLEKASLSYQDLSDFSVTREDIGKYALELVKKMNGTYITTCDIVASYLLLTETKTKLLFSKKIKSEELIHLLFWVRAVSNEENYPHKLQVRMSGAGFGEALTTGWTPETEKYTDNFTYRSVFADAVSTGREDEFTTMLESLVKANNNNVMLVGEAGSGKENLVTLLAKKSFTGELGGTLDNKVIFELMLGPLIAGTADRGLLEERLQAVIAEVAHSGNVLLYIPEFQNILGSSTYNIDLSGAILPYLKEGYLPIIATITPGNYKTFLEKSPLREVFSVIHLPEPDENTAMHMVLDKTSALEKKYQVIIPYQAVRESISYAKRYLPDDVLPGSAIALLEDTANTISLTKREKFGSMQKKLLTPEDVIQKVEEKSHIAISTPHGKEKEVLLHLEEKLHGRIVGQDTAIHVVSEAMRRLRTGLFTSSRPVSFLFLGPTGVGKTETAKALADLYFGGEQHMLRLDMSEYADENGIKRLLGAPPGEGEERGELTDKVHDNPSSLILLDEFEKAHPVIRDLFLQVFEDGRLTDNKGRTVSFINTIIIATSNAASEFIRQQVKQGLAIDKHFQQSLLNELQSKSIFKPELLNRFDDVVIFSPLKQEETLQIAKLLLQDIVKNLEKDDIAISFSDGVLQKIATEGYDQEFGARPVRRYIQDTIEDLIAKKKLTGEIKRGNTVAVTLDSSGTITCNVS